MEETRKELSEKLEELNNKELETIIDKSIIDHLKEYKNVYLSKMQLSSVRVYLRFNMEKSKVIKCLNKWIDDNKNTLILSNREPVGIEFDFNTRVNTKFRIIFKNKDGYDYSVEECCDELS